MTLNNKHQALLQFSYMGEGALLCEAQEADNQLQLVTQQRVWQLAEHARQLAHVLEVVPGMNNVLIIFDLFGDLGSHLDATSDGNSDSASGSNLADKLKANIDDFWSNLLSIPTNAHTATTHHIPVTYGGENGKDIIELAAYTGLSIDEIIERHSQAQYTVYALGSQPGLPYLGGLDPKIAMPRRATPRTKVEAGAIIIGGSQASILSRTSACGWHIIGHTEAECFNPEKEPPALFAPGDNVKFVIKEILL